MEKKELLKDLIMRLHRGEDEVTVKQDFKKHFDSVSSSEIAQMEQELMKEGFEPKQIQKLCNVHAEVFSGSIEDIHTTDEVDKTYGHPLFVFRRENDGLVKILNNDYIPALKAFKETKASEDKKRLMDIIKELKKVDKHYKRKEILFFPYLEKAGITGPPQVMWGKDDDIRDLFKELNKENITDERFIAIADLLCEELISMVKKENEILSPMLLKNLKTEDFLQISKDSLNMEFAFNKDIEGANLSDINTWINQNEGRTLVGNILLTDKKKDSSMDEGYISLPSGKVKLSDFNHMLNTHPQDMTFIDKDDKVVYFSEGKHPVFPRTRTIIGRDVRLCHPPKSQPVVDFLLETFKEGIADEETRMVKLGDKILLIRYYAVRDEEKNYIGTLEVTEEISDIIKRANALK